MCAEQLRERLQDHRAEEVATGMETETVDETTGPEGRSVATTDEGMTDGGEERETIKREKVLEIVQLAF